MAASRFFKLSVVNARCLSCQAHQWMRPAPQRRCFHTFPTTLTRVNADALAEPSIVNSAVLSEATLSAKLSRSQQQPSTRVHPSHRFTLQMVRHTPDGRISLNDSASSTGGHPYFLVQWLSLLLEESLFGYRKCLTPSLVVKRGIGLIEMGRCRNVHLRQIIMRDTWKTSEEQIFRLDC